MSDYIDRIKNLQEISSKLEPSESERREYLNEIKRYSDNFINNLGTTPAFNGEKYSPESLAIKSNNSIKDIVKVYEDEVSSKGINPASGGHFGYIPGGGIYASALADYMVAISNDYVGMNFSCPGGVAIEHEMLNWMKSVFGYPESAVGNLTSGGSIANLIALTSARDAHQIKNEKITNSVIYLSPQVHHCIQKALRIIGLEDVKLNYLDLDDKSRIDVKALDKKIQEDLNSGFNPFLVIGSAGTTDTGAIDPLNGIADIAEKHNLWFHIDAAYGGFFMLVESVKNKFKGLERSDSLVIDPHKGLFLPYGLGAVLIKDRKAVYKSHVYRANYMQDALGDDNFDNPADVSPELTKHFRSLRMWLPLQLYGVDPFKACLEEKLLLTNYFRNLLDQNGFMVGPEPDLSVSYFWFPFTDRDQNEGNKALLNLLHKDGEIFFSSTVIDNRFVIRIAILSFRTKLETVDRAMTMLNRNLKTLLNVQ